MGRLSAAGAVLTSALLLCTLLLTLLLLCTLLLTLLRLVLTVAPAFLFLRTGTLLPAVTVAVVLAAAVLGLIAFTALLLAAAGQYVDNLL